VEWKGKWTSKLHGWETWEQEAGRPCEHFRKLLDNDEYEEFVTLFQEVIGNREALILLSWFVDGLLQEAAWLKRSRFYPDLILFASPKSLSESMRDDSTLKRLILEAVRDTPDHQVPFPKKELKGYVDTAHAIFPGLHTRWDCERRNYCQILWEPFQTRVAMAFLGLQNWELYENRQRVEEKIKEFPELLNNLVSLPPYSREPDPTTGSHRNEHDTKTKLPGG